MLQESFCLLIRVHFLSILIIGFTEGFPAPPVLLYAYYSRLNFTMLGEAILKDVFKKYWQQFGHLCITMVRVALS